MSLSPISSGNIAAVLLSLGLVGVVRADDQSAAAPAILPGTAPLEWPEADLSERLMDGAHRFVERKIAEAPAGRTKFWARDYSSAQAYEQSVDANRQRFKTIIGAVDQRLSAAMERYGDEENPALVAETA